MELCHQNRVCNKQLAVNDGSQDGHTSVKKRPRLEEETSVSNKWTQEEVLYKFKDIISVVPKYSVSEFRSLLMEKQKLFPVQTMEDISTESAASVNGNRLQDIINAFCHPEVISKAKDKILMQV
jgi:hypothetical protein